MASHVLLKRKVAASLQDPAGGPLATGPATLPASFGVRGEVRHYTAPDLFVIGLRERPGATMQVPGVAQQPRVPVDVGVPTTLYEGPVVLMDMQAPSGAALVV